MLIETSIPLDDWRAVAPAARTLESLGFQGLMASEIANDPFVPLALAALATERARLATAIVVVFPRSPTVLAHQAWDLHVNSRGRFVLGLGVQVKGHNERRYGIPWSAPVPRLREYVEALRAIWRCWEKHEPLRVEGEHYRLSLMTPEFSPPPSGLPPVPVTIAAVGPHMLRLAGRVCDGVRLHGFCTRRYLEEVALPRVGEGLERAGRERQSFEIWGGGFVATGRDQAEVARALEWVRYRVAFYGSTRTYAPVLELHGWEELGARLHRLSKQGRWKEMAAEVSDDVLHAFVAAAPYPELGAAVERRFGGLVDALALNPPEPGGEGGLREALQDLRRLPSAFTGFPGAWS